MLQSTRKTQDERRRNFKKGIDTSENRRQRENEAVSIRKEKRADMVSKKRQMIMQPEDGVPMEMPREDITSLVKKVYQGDAQTRLENVIKIRRLLSSDDQPPIPQIIKTGVVPTFIRFLREHDQPKLQFESAWVLTNIASGTADQTKLVVSEGGIPAFVELLSSSSEQLREQAAWALGNIAGDCTEFRDRVLRAGALPPLLIILCQSQVVTMLRNCSWTLSNFCRGKPSPDFGYLKPAIPVLARLLLAPDDEILADACWALSYLTDGPNERIQAVIEDNIVVTKMIELLSHGNPAVQTPALRVVGNIVTGNEGQTQSVLDDPRALPALRNMLMHVNKGIRKEACWTISNITAGTKEQIGDVIQAGIMPVVIELLREAEFEIKKEAAWALSNACSCGTPDQVRYLVSKGVIPLFCDLLSSYDSATVNVSLDALGIILGIGEIEAEVDGVNPHANLIVETGGADALHQLQETSNNVIYDKVSSIIEQYFDENDEDDELQPEQGDGQFKFGMNNTPNNFHLG